MRSNWSVFGISQDLDCTRVTSDAAESSAVCMCASARTCLPMSDDGDSQRQLGRAAPQTSCAVANPWSAWIHTDGLHFSNAKKLTNFEKTNIKAPKSGTPRKNDTQMRLCVPLPQFVWYCASTFSQAAMHQLARSHILFKLTNTFACVHI